MRRLKSKASQFFSYAPTQDEEVAITPTYPDTEFGAGIECGLGEKRECALGMVGWRGKQGKQGEKKMQCSPRVGEWEGEKMGSLRSGSRGSASRPVSRPALRPGSRPVSRGSASPPPSHGAPSKLRKTPDEESHDSTHKSTPGDAVLKKRPSFASLRKSSSRIFRSNTGNQDAPPPPMPQIPIHTPTPKPRRPALRPFESVLSSRSSRSSQIRTTSISRPLSTLQSPLPPNFDPHKVPFTPRPGPPPSRPARPASIDKDLVAMSLDSTARTTLYTPTRTRTRTPTSSTTSSAHSPTLLRIVSQEAYTRLGLPSGHSSLSTTHSPLFDAPLAANFPPDPAQPLPFRDTNGIVRAYGRFSAFIKAHQQYASGGYTDDGDASDRELGPVEWYCGSRCADWTLETRVSAGSGERAMVFRDRWGGWHVVRDV